MSGPDPLADVRTALALDDGPSPARARDLLRVRLGPRDRTEYLAALRTLDREQADEGMLTELLADPEVTDVLVTGAADVRIDRGRGLEPVPSPFPDDAAVTRLATRLLTAAGRRLDTAAPFADAVLPSGHRVHAVLPPVSRRPLLSLRAAPAQRLTWADLERAGTVGPATAQLLRQLVLRRTSLLVTGGTGSGKTTLLAALLDLCAAAERVVAVEDPPELVARCPAIIGLAARSANAEGAGEVTVRQLVREALRMRPDRIVVGEARGPEVLDLLVALNAGHAGAATVHANAAADVPARMEALAGLAGLPRAAAHSLLAATGCVVVALARDADGRRVVTEIAALRRVRSGRVVAVPMLIRSGSQERTGPLS